MPKTSYSRRRATPLYKPQVVIIFLLLLLTFTLSINVSAQEEMTEEEDLLVLEEVIVTAQKRQQMIQDVPSSIAAVTAETLSQSATSNFVDLGKLTSGVNIAGNPDGFGKLIRIRGIGTNLYVPGIRPAVGIFIEDVPITQSEAAFNNLADIERIEILKGPQATLFGKEVSSGAISIFLKRPHSEQFEGYVEANLGTQNLRETRLGFNIPISDSLSTRIALYSNHKDSQIKNIVTGDQTQYDASGVRARVLWEQSDSFNALFSYERHDSEIDGTETETIEHGDVTLSLAERYNVNLLRIDPFDGKVQTTGSIGRETKTELATLRLEWELDDFTVTSITAKQDWDQDADKGDLEFGAADGTIGIFETFKFVTFSAAKTFTQELRFTYEGERLATMIGAFYSDDETSSFTPLSILVAALPPGPIAPVATDLRSAPLSDIREETDEWAIFNHNTLTITDALELTFGVRYSEADKEYFGGQPLGAGLWGDQNGFIAAESSTDGTISLGDVVLESEASTWEIPKQSDKWSAATGSLKLNYRFDEGYSVYAGIDRGYKAGGFNVVKHVSGTTDPLGGPAVSFTPEDFDSEYALSVELGMKGNFVENRLRINSSIFRASYDDFQVEIQDSDGPGNTIQNAAEVIISGFEFETTYLLSHNWIVDANMTYIDARFGKYDTADCIRPQRAAVDCTDADGNETKLDLEDKRVNATSPWTANISGQYANSFRSAPIDWFLRLEMAFRDDRIDFPDLDKATASPSYILYNASLGFVSANETWEVLFWGKNLTNEEYVALHSRLRDSGDSRLSALSGATSSEGLAARIGEERTFGANFKYNF